MASNPKRLKMSEDASCSTNQKKPYFNFTSSNLGDLVNMKAFVDKTLMIKQIFEEKPKILITAPPRFGKSSNMDMVKKFVEIQVDENGTAIRKEDSSNYKIFKDNNLLIFRNKVFFKKHFATFPVIYVSFTSVAGEGFYEILNGFKEALQDAFKQHRYLLDSDKLCLADIAKLISRFDAKSYDIFYDVHFGLGFLAKCLYTHFNKKVFVLIDNFNAPYQSNTVFYKNNVCHRVDEIFQAMYTNILMFSDKYVERALVTGTSSFVDSVGIAETIEIEKFLFLTKHPFVPYYGVTVDEVNKLLTKFKIDKETKKKVKLHYSAYVSLDGVKLFSIWSILHFLQKKEIKNYWQESGDVINLKEALNVFQIRSCVETLCLGLPAEILLSYIFNFENDFLKFILNNACRNDVKMYHRGVYLLFLFQQGYLTTAFTDYQYSAHLKLNTEFLSYFRKTLLNHYGKYINSCIKRCAISFNKLSSSLETKIFHDFITNFNKLLTKVKNKFSEITGATYYCIMYFILCKTKFSFVTNPVAKVDLIVHAKDVGIIIELESEKFPMRDLHQTQAEHLNVFKDDPRFKHITKCLYIGININKHDVAEISVLIL